MGEGSFFPRRFFFFPSFSADAPVFWESLRGHPPLSYVVRNSLSVNHQFFLSLSVLKDEIVLPLSFPLK